jgi:hypothetical protein
MYRINFKESEDRARCLDVIFLVFNFWRATAPACTISWQLDILYDRII